MARDVHNMLQKIVEDEGKMEPGEAEKFLQDLMTKECYVQDVWG